MSSPNLKQSIEEFVKWKLDEEEKEIKEEERITKLFLEGTSEDEEEVEQKEQVVDPKDIKISQLEEEIERLKKLVSAYNNNITFVYCEHCAPKEN